MINLVGLNMSFLLQKEKWKSVDYYLIYEGFSKNTKIGSSERKKNENDGAGLIYA